MNNGNGSTSNNTKNEDANDRFEKLKQASLEHFTTGISLRNAAKKCGVGVAELKYFYENEAAEFLPNPAESSDDDDDYN